MNELWEAVLRNWHVGDDSPALALERSLACVGRTLEYGAGPGPTGPGPIELTLVAASLIASNQHFGDMTLDTERFFAAMKPREMSTTQRRGYAAALFHKAAVQIYLLDQSARLKGPHNQEWLDRLNDCIGEAFAALNVSPAKAKTWIHQSFAELSC